MNPTILTVSLVALAALLPLAASQPASVSIAISGEGILVHEGTGAVEPALVEIGSLAAQTFRAAPYTGIDGEGTLVISTPSRTITVTVVLSGDVVAREILGRNVESWTLGLDNANGSGTLALAGSDGFLRGPGALEILVPSGPDHGRMDLAFVATAEVLR